MEVLMSDYSRLDRIEEKIDKLTDAMVTIARAEEKLVNMEQKYSAQYDRMNKFSEKLDALEKITSENSQTVYTINKLFWVALIAVVGAIAANLLM
jgi:ABC-type Fe3+-hydroxamate transport system substrate-binding protein